jgi:hypothetical protein
MGCGAIACASSRATFDPPFNSMKVEYHKPAGSRKARFGPPHTSIRCGPLAHGCVAELLSFVMLEIVFGVAMFMVVAFPGGASRSGRGRRSWAGDQVSYSVIIVRTRMLSIGKGYEEGALELGAPSRADYRAASKGQVAKASR